MSIRVSQPAINLREKLTEVDSPPIGSHGSEMMNSSTTKESFDLVKAGRNNMIINGDFQIAQRATTATNLNGNYWAYNTVDRWALGMSGAGTWTASQDSDVPDGYGFTKSWKLVCNAADAAVDAGDYFLLEQKIEANRMAHLCWGTKRAKPATLSFWVKSSVTGDCNAMFHADNFNVTRIINQTFAIHNANEWEFKTMTFTAPGPENSWTTDNTTGIRLWLWFKAGTTWTAGTGTRNYWRNNAGNQQAPGTTINIASATDNNLLITGVQLEEGYNATPFDYKSYADQLHDCQRYYVRMNGSTGGLSTNDGALATLANWTDTAAYGPIFMPVEMRQPPALAGYSQLKYYSAGQTFIPSGSEAVFTGAANDRVEIRLNNMTNMTQGNAGWLRVDNTNGYMDFNSEY